MPFKVENNAQTLLKQLQNNFEKVQKTTFLTPKMIPKMTLKTAKMSKLLTENSDFGVSTLRAENTTKSRPFKIKNIRFFF